MADLYANYAELSAARVEGTDYAINTKELPNTTALYKAIHGGGIEAGTSEIVKEAAKNLASYYEFDAMMSSGNSDLHITSTNFDEPRLLDMMTRHSHVISVHGYYHATEKKTLVGGLDYAVCEIVKDELAKEGFIVEVATGGIAGTETNNVANKTTRGMGVQLELSTPLRQSFFTNNDYSRANRLAGNYTTDFWKYVKALKRIMKKTKAKYPFSHVEYDGREDIETLKLDHKRKIGDIATLGTTDKTSVVGAVNESLQKIDVLSSDVTDLSFLDTKNVNFKRYIINGETHFAKAINRALAENQNVIAPYGEYTIDETINIPQGKTLDLNGSILKPVSDIDCVIVRKNATFKNFEIDTRGVTGYSKSAIYLDGKDLFTIASTTRIETGILRGVTSTAGRGIFFDASMADNAYIVSVKTRNIMIRNFKKGIELLAKNEGNYVNGNTFDSVDMFGCSEFIRIDDGGNSSGADNNIFGNIGIQPDSAAELAVYFGGHRNTFDGSLWDTGWFPNQESFVFSQNARNNSITTRGGATKVRNNNGMNQVNSNTDGTQPLVFISPKDKVQSADTRYTLRNYIGNQDNALANAHKKYIVSFTGKLPDSQIRAFNLEPSQYSSWTSLTPTDEVKVTIDMTADPLRFGNVIGCAFVYMSIPDYIRIDVEKIDGTITTIKEETNFSGGYVYQTYESIPDTVNKVIFVMKRSNGTSIRVSQFFASGNGTKGNHFLNTSGGKLYGDVEFDVGTGAIIKSPNGTKYRITVDDTGTLSTTVVS
ncbi:hypothetical protein BEH_24200 [Priestia filamentosa]|uniref:Uncharacterized protein n=1 Tax=Priestia filamentosa TaxID=1402861 RepID=A0A2S1LZA5_9BACI|nr:poly-gamma-glutamate hydrolase family protein [Priestia filamentosa]AWG44154.1 hypothetical protein BEH_24200 [Priestia filamentosa]